MSWRIRRRAGVAALAAFPMIVMLLAAAYGRTDLEQLLPERPDWAPNRYFLVFRGGIAPTDITDLTALGITVRHLFPELGAAAIEVATEDQLLPLAASPRVAGIEQEPMRYAADLSTEQLVPAPTNGLYGLIATRAIGVHQQGITGAGINVGIADTGIDYTHPDIQPNYKGGIDIAGKGNDPWWRGNPGETHATHVAGTILGANNSVGVYGVAYNANLYHARVLGATGGGSTSDVMAGVQWLVETAHCKVVNLSLGGRASSNTEETFFNNMRAEGALVVCAAGNDGRKALSYPAGYAANIAVGAVDRNNAHASFSNTGPNLDVSAPGVGVLSSVPAGKGNEASVTTNTTFTASGLQYGGNTTGVGGTLVDCGGGKTGDFPDAVAGNIALIRRGDTTFSDKVKNAMAAGAAAAVIYNNVAGDYSGSLGSAGTWIPAVSVSDAAGATLLAAAGTTATIVSEKSSWDTYSGTSMATPHVTGAIALIWSVNPGLSNDGVEKCLFDTCQDLGAPGYDTTYGYGLIDATAAVAEAISGLVH